MTDALIDYGLVLVILLIPLGIYLWSVLRKEALTRRAAEEGTRSSEQPRAQHPHINLSTCIGCGSCVSACPEKDVLGLVKGKAVILNGSRCVGHGLCAAACPVEAIVMRMAAPGLSVEHPFLTPEHETNIPNLFIAGELGGLALIKNAIEQGRECIDIITARLKASPSEYLSRSCYDVCIVGAGPAGISASLRAIENGLRYITLEQGDIGGTVASYPRQKLVMTTPVIFPIYGSFRKMSLSKEEILALWEKIGRRADFAARTQESVEEVIKERDGLFAIATTKGRYRASAVILAIGLNGVPRKLGVVGEDLPKVMHRLIDAEEYRNFNLLVVGGGDSAVEAAMGLASQKGNCIHLSYRGDSFRRIKQRNLQRIEEHMRSGKVQVLFNSNLVEIKGKNVVLRQNGKLMEIPNDFVWIFAGGTPPYAFLQKMGVQFGAEVVEGAREAELFRK